MTMELAEGDRGGGGTFEAGAAVLEGGPGTMQVRRGNLCNDPDAYVARRRRERGPGRRVAGRARFALHGQTPPESAEAVG